MKKQSEAIELATKTMLRFDPNAEFKYIARVEFLREFADDGKRFGWRATFAVTTRSFGVNDETKQVEIEDSSGEARIVQSM